jgi:hypothetical protein
MLQNYQEKNKYSKLRITKDLPNLKEIKNLFNCMNTIYDGMKNHHELDKFLRLPPKNFDSDASFKKLRPNCPYSLSELLSDKMNKDMFNKYIQPEENEFKN